MPRVEARSEFGIGEALDASGRRGVGRTLRQSADRARGKLPAKILTSLGHLEELRGKK
jgi:hypothetical protein